MVRSLFGQAPVFSLLLCLLGGLGMAPRGASAAEELPKLKYVGIIPVYWQGDFPSDHGFQRIRAAADRDFPQINRDSKRFNFINDTIISDSWSSPAGRKKLQDDHEIDAFMNLTVTQQADVSQFTVRLLGPNLENYLTESERIPLSWLHAASAKDFQEKLRRLTYRVLNRYPLDVFVTSLQGRYITLSSGREQNVFDGDVIDITQVMISSRHPVDGSWLTFEHKPLGKAKIIESKTQSSIAQITSLNAENAIKVGTGARVEAIASRRIFQEQPNKADAFVSAEGSPIIEPLSKPKAVEKPAPKPNKMSLSAKDAPPVKVASAEEPPLPSALDNPEVIDPGARASTDEDEEVAENQAEGSLFANFFNFKTASFSLENETLSYSGGGSMSSEQPAWLINRAGARGSMDLAPDQVGNISALIRSGKSKKGNYFGFGLGAEFLHKISMASGNAPSLENILVGGLLTVESIGVSGGSFGGMDAIELAPIVRFQGSYHIPDLIETVGYDFSARYFPFALGTAGIKGKTRDMSNGSRLEFEAEVIRKTRGEEIQWGGLFGLTQEDWKLSKGKIKSNSFRFGLVGKMAL